MGMVCVTRCLAGPAIKANSPRDTNHSHNTKLEPSQFLSFAHHGREQTGSEWPQWGDSGHNSGRRWVKILFFGPSWQELMYFLKTGHAFLPSHLKCTLCLASCCRLLHTKLRAPKRILKITPYPCQYIWYPWLLKQYTNIVCQSHWMQCANFRPSLSS